MQPALVVVVDGTRVVVSTHAVLVLAAVVAGTALLVARSPRVAQGLWLSAIVTVTALAGARALYAPLHPGRGSMALGGLASMGGIVAGLAVTIVWARLTATPVVVALDALAPPALLALAVGRIGCFLAGCCYGRPTALPWGVVLPDLGLPARHPVQLYAAAGDALLVAWLLVTRGPPGTVHTRALVGFGLLRAALEVLRDPAATDPVLGGRLTLAQAAALAMAALGLAGQRLARARDVD